MIEPKSDDIGRFVVMQMPESDEIAVGRIVAIYPGAIVVNFNNEAMPRLVNPEHLHWSEPETY